METASHMSWHRENRSSSGVLRHPSEGEAWKHFDRYIQTLQLIHAMYVWVYALMDLTHSFNQQSLILVGQ